MVRASRGLRGLAALWWLGVSGCTTLREIPPDAYARADERKHVAVDTQDGEHHEFDFVRVGSDTLTGFQRRDVPGDFEEYDTRAIPLVAITKLSARRIDWYRTGLIGGAAIAAVVLAALARHKDDTTLPPEPEPCPVEPCP